MRPPIRRYNVHMLAFQWASLTANQPRSASTIWFHVADT
jgi:hypothetical protein